MARTCTALILHAWRGANLTEVAEALHGTNMGHQSGRQTARVATGQIDQLDLPTNTGSWTRHQGPARLLFSGGGEVLLARILAKVVCAGTGVRGGMGGTIPMRRWVCTTATGSTHQQPWP